VRPLVLGPNQPRRFYRGGGAIARFRGLEQTGEYVPEDWVGSATSVFGDASAGLTRLDGTTLRDVLAADPDAFFGRAHGERHGGDPCLLVKLLDAGERLPVHCHPDRAFAQGRLGSPYGKTEAWLILGTQPGRASVHLGFRDDVDAETLAGWVSRQDRPAMLAALHELPVEPGDTLFVPAGVPHAIGEGVFLLELQEPSDLSVLLEWSGFAIDGERDGHLGLGFGRALECVDRSRLEPDRLASLEGSGVHSLFPAEADPFFRAERLGPTASLEPAFSILVVLEGAGRLETERGGELALECGQTVLVPYASGQARLVGDVDVVRCMPPEVG
jgi:mannose-6-phosphate isomerase